MSVFKLNFIAPSTEDFKKIGVDKAYVDFAIKQHEFRTVKISDLSCAQANILKQTAIACGTDCAVHRETITGKIEKTDCILSGTMREFEKICEKLSGQPLKLKILAEEIKRFVLEPPGVFLINKKRFERSKCYIMGILNITPDSFSDGGKYFDKEKALKHADELIQDGADILDIGGESTRPYAEPVTADEEIENNTSSPHLIIIDELYDCLSPELGVRFEYAVHQLDGNADVLIIAASKFSSADIITDIIQHAFPYRITSKQSSDLTSKIFIGEDYAAYIGQEEVIIKGFVDDLLLSNLKSDGIENEEMDEDSIVLAEAERILEKHLSAFKELAK